MKDTKVISGFPAVGKSYLFNNTELDILDSDSSTFDKTHFPENYIKHIKDNIGKVDVILVSSHDVVRKALLRNDILFTIVYPNINLKDEYIERYKKRGNPQAFIDLVDINWVDWITDIKNMGGNCMKLELLSGEYLSDVIDLIDL